ncbi:MAG: sodium transporter [Bacteroidales bacterium]|nr:sodium transporter [Bacteroidales bacterium]
MSSLVTAVLLFVIILAVGFSFSRRQGSLLAFVSADGSLPWSLAGLSLFVSFFSAGTFVAWGGIAYLDGMVAIMIQETICLAGLVCGLLIAPRWKRTGTRTAAEYLERRYGAQTRNVFTLLFFFLSVLSSAAFLYPVAKLLSVFSGWDLAGCTIGLGGLCVLYVSVGGLWSVVVTDVIQFFILTAVVLIAVPLSLQQAGGAETLRSALDPSMLRPVSEGFPALFLFAFFLYNVAYLGGGWSFVQKYGAVRTSRDVRRSGLLFSVLYGICPFLWMLPAVCWRVIGGAADPAQAEGAFLSMCKLCLPDGLMGIMLSALVFSSMSSMNAQLNAMASVFARDLSSRPDKLRTARRTGIVLGVVIIALALLIPRSGGLVNYIVSLSALVGAPLYMPVVWSLFSGRQTGRSLCWVVLLSLAVNLVLKLGLYPSLDNARTVEMTVGVGAPLVLLLLFEFQARLSGRPEVPMPESKPSDNRSAGEANRYGLRVLAWGIMAMGALFVVVSFRDARGRVLTFLSGVVLLVAASVVLAASRKPSNLL